MSEVRCALRISAANGPRLAPCWLAVLVALALSVSKVCADAPAMSQTAAEPHTATQLPDRTSTSGLAIGTGAGSDNVWLGGHVVYYAQLSNPKLRVAFHVGAGVIPWVDPNVQWGIRGGSFVSYGKRHRLVFGVMGGTIDWQTFGLHYHALQSRQVFGVGVGLGYEFMSKAGFYVRSTVGPALAVFPEVPFYGRELALVWRGNLLAVGYKLW